MSLTNPITPPYLNLCTMKNKIIQDIKDIIDVSDILIITMILNIAIELQEKEIINYCKTKTDEYNRNYCK